MLILSDRGFMYKEIRTANKGNIFLISLNRPEKLNAFTRIMQDELIEVFDYTDSNDDIKAVVITGNGKAFCAGADLVGGANTFNYAEEDNKLSNKDHRDGGGLVALRIFESKKPVIGAINGDAVGVGVTMTLPMDIRMASSAARIGFVFSRRGIVPEACSSYFLPRAVGVSKALEWAYSGRVFDAQEAHEAGLVRSIHEPDELLPAAREVALEIAENTSAVSVTMIRHMMWRMLGADHPMEAHKIDSRGIYHLGQGAVSFLEKRPAAFTLKTSEDMPEFFPWWDERHFE